MARLVIWGWLDGGGGGVLTSILQHGFGLIGGCAARQPINHIFKFSLININVVVYILLNLGSTCSPVPYNDNMLYINLLHQHVYTYVTSYFTYIVLLRQCFCLPGA